MASSSSPCRSAVAWAAHSTSDACQEEADANQVPFRKFSLQDCRPKAVSDKLARGDADVIDATMHSSERMVRQVYDRRRVRVAKPAK